MREVVAAMWGWSIGSSEAIGNTSVAVNWSETRGVSLIVAFHAR